MNHEELLKLVRDTSISLMNTCQGDGTISECYEDDEIIAKFGGMTKAEVIAKVTEMDGASADRYNEVLMWSGEYQMVDGVAISVYQLEAQAELARIKANEAAYAEFLAQRLDPEYAERLAKYAATNYGELDWYLSLEMRDRPLSKGGFFTPRKRLTLEPPNVRALES